MCGIVGQINFDKNPVSPVVLKKMTDAIRHRGPDGEGHWIEESVGFGHRRLSIIDPLSFRQATNGESGSKIYFNIQWRGIQF